MHESEKWKWSCSVVSDSSDPMDCSLPGSSVHGIFQARVLEWGAIAFSSYLCMSLISPGLNCLWFTLAILTWDPWTFTYNSSWKSLGSCIFPLKYLFIIHVQGFFFLKVPRDFLFACYVCSYLTEYCSASSLVAWPLFSRQCSVLLGRVRTILSTVFSPQWASPPYC